jgi:hypothetical protein
MLSPRVTPSWSPSRISSGVGETANIELVFIPTTFQSSKIRMLRLNHLTYRANWNFIGLSLLVSPIKF